MAEPEPREIEARPKAAPPDRAGRIPRDASVPELVRDLADGTQQLVRQEIALVKAELRLAIDNGRRGFALMVVAAILMGLAGATLVAAAVLALSVVLLPWAAALVVGVVLLAVGGGAVASGRRRLREARSQPRRSLDSLKEDGEWIRRRLS